MAAGEQDSATVTPDWLPVAPPPIDGVVLKHIRPVATATGYLTEMWRGAWGLDQFGVDQVFMRTLYPGAISGWHAHATTTDRLFCAAGAMRLSLFDGRRTSPSFGTLFHVVAGDKRPTMVVVPPGIWHGVKSIGAETALLINIVDRAYSYDSPDHWRLPPDTEHINLA